MPTNVPITVAYGDGWELTMIDCRGVQVWPDGISETWLTGAPGYSLWQGQ
jgi:hypothetical protein